jgi:hypothetical protein
MPNARMLFSTLGLLLVGPFAVRRAADAQTPATVTVRVHVTDSAGVAVPGAEIAIVRGVNDVITRAVTDDFGRQQLLVRKDNAEYQVVVRKIGFRRADRFTSGATRDTFNLNFILARATQPLAPVVVSAEEELRRRAYHIEADEIANSGRVVLDVLDVLGKLRPDMVWGLSGRPDRIGKRQALPIYYGEGPPLQNVWVNGRRIFLVPPDQMTRARARTGAARPVPLQVKTILASIHAEHVAEITYAPASDVSVGTNRSSNAVFVVLKPGVAFEPGRGSYVVGDDSVAGRALVTAPSLVIRDWPPFRFRVLGVFDAQTGEALPNVDVIETVSGLRARTTETGTVSLFFLPEGNSTVRIEKAGYEPMTLTVAISPGDTVPVTLTLSKKK